MHEYDKSSKWLIEHHGDSILRLAGITGFTSWRPLQAELIQPRQLPDGLLEVVMGGDPDPHLFLLEIATYPEERLGEQLVRDVMLVFLDRRALPEVITLILYPKGRQIAPSGRQLRSRLGRTQCRIDWPVIKLWEIPAEDLLATEDVGLVPWIPLSRITSPSEKILNRCREIIDHRAAAEERENLLVVTQVLAHLRFGDPRLLELLGGKQIMIESPLIQEIFQEIFQEKIQRHILKILEGRFQSVPAEVKAKLLELKDDEKLLQLVGEASACPDLDSFRAHLN